MQGCRQLGGEGWKWGTRGFLHFLSSDPGLDCQVPVSYKWASLVVQLVKNLPTMWETRVRSLGWGYHAPWFKPVHFLLSDEKLIFSEGPHCHKTHIFFPLNFIYLFIWLCLVLAAVHRIFYCGVWTPWVRKIPWRRDRLPTPVFLGFPCGSAGKESACNVGDLGLIPGWEDPLEKRKATHSSILAWRIPWTVHGVSKSQTWLSDFHSLTVDSLLEVCGLSSCHAWV